MNTYNRMTDEDTRTLADLLDKQENVDLTDREQALLGELLEKQKNHLPPDQNETLLKAARYAVTIALGTPLHARLRACGLTERQLDLYREIRGRLDKDRNDARITPDEMREFEDVRRRIDRCLRGGGDPPDNVGGPDDSGPSITDALGVQPNEEEDEAEPAPTLPVEEPAPVLVPVPGKDEDEKKKKLRPRSRVPVKKGGVDFP